MSLGGMEGVSGDGSARREVSEGVSDGVVQGKKVKVRRRGSSEDGGDCQNMWRATRLQAISSSVRGASLVDGTGAVMRTFWVR